MAREAGAERVGIYISFEWPDERSVEAAAGRGPVAPGACSTRRKYHFKAIHTRDPLLMWCFLRCCNCFAYAQSHG